LSSWTRTVLLSFFQWRNALFLNYFLLHQTFCLYRIEQNCLYLFFYWNFMSRFWPWPFFHSGLLFHSNTWGTKTLFTWICISKIRIKNISFICSLSFTSTSMMTYISSFLWHVSIVHNFISFPLYWWHNITIFQLLWLNRASMVSFCTNFSTYIE
jgi:hypothetical protein